MPAYSAISAHTNPAVAALLHLRTIDRERQYDPESNRRTNPIGYDYRARR